MHKIPSEQAAFQFMLDCEAPGGLPTAQVVQWGQGVWVKVCPLCGLLHEVRGGLPADGLFKPSCIVRQLVPKLYQEWTTKHPQALDYTHVRLMGIEAIRIVTPAKPEKRAKARAA